MADELTLPKLIRNESHSTDAIPSHFSKKRVRDSPPPDSSDQPIFSSDDDPSVEKYTQGRRKQRFRGPWFNQQLASDPPALDDEPARPRAPVKHKRKFQRQVDSGIFMGSDGTDLEEAESAVEDRINIPVPPAPQSQKYKMALNPPKDVHAQTRIEKCLEKGEENIDLSRLALEDLSSATIIPLKGFIKPVLSEYTNLEPSLKIILSSNLLTRLPAELFNLDRLVFLSLRNNRLRELPPAIGKLKNLEDLNISQNKLGYLPYEILDLFLAERSSLFDLQLHPNPFYMPIARPETPNEAPHFTVPLKRRRGSARHTSVSATPLPPTAGGLIQTRDGLPQTAFPAAWSWAHTTDNQPSDKCLLIRQFRTEVRFLDAFGRRVKGPVFPSDPSWVGTGRGVKLPVADPDDIPIPPREEPLVQSLVEIALKACSRHPELQQLNSYLDHPPPQIPSLLQRAENFHHSGSTFCTICDREYIIPRTEWIEWWEINESSIRERAEASGVASAASPLRRVENERDAMEKLVPLIRRGCSWLCTANYDQSAQERWNLNKASNEATDNVTTLVQR
ncbi:leucine Rich Repeat family protein [Rutstroemia sp. NJR-2017a WRK4]|nr:leucine Rich Repeat family protein [Rutstroemia sp. NJR-2017a WRK4]